ncbi:MAG: DUF4878 domain-containing protein [Bacteroidetes bacterium]|nr:DUF4878 domain-containing protein [Bacteroidota bacterium]
MKSKITNLTIAISFLFLVGCSGTRSPEGAVKELLKRIEKKDKSASDLIYFKEFSEHKYERFSEKNEAASQKFANEGGIKEILFKDVIINADNAALKVLIVYKSGREDDERLELRKIDGSWKVVYESLY